ncbi:MAG TPA: ATP synthase F1 subunit delta [Gemmatimonadota bacterium]|nr:ATP synthase F1 subunit delta [Gemmatimonadota bacterium]
MRAGTIARVYARTLLGEAEREHALDDVDASMAAMVAALGASPKLKRFLEGPQIEPADKKALLEQVFAEQVHPLALRFVFLVIDKHRETLLEEIVAAWDALLDERAGRQSATVTAATPLGDDVLERLKGALERRTGMTIRLEHRVDPALLGGLVVRSGDTVIDGSLRTRLRALRRRLAAAGAAPWQG